jgi:LuxR family maltose regulon positive regulatory protein
LENNELSHEAIRHAIAGGDFELAAHLVERQLSANWLKGELKTLQGWLSAIPVSFWRIHPRLWLVQAWVAMTIGDLVEGDANLKAAEEALDLLDEELASKLRPEVLAFRASYASLVQGPHAIELVRQALEILPKDHWIRGMLVVFLGSAYYSAGNLDSALEALTHAPVSAQSTSRIQPHRVHVLAFGGMVYYAKGQLREALKLLYKAIEQAEPGGIPIPYVGTLLAYISIAPVLYEQNELEQARVYLNRCLEMATDFGSAEVQVYALSLLACICLSNNDLQTAISYYEKIDSLLQEHVFSPSIMAYVDYRRFQVYLKQRNTEAAATWVEAHKDTSDLLNSYALHRIASPQFLIAQGQFDAASKELTTLVKDAQEAGHGNLLVKALVLQSLAYEGCGNQANALSILEHVLSLSEPEGYIRSFMEEGEPMRLLLVAFLAQLQERQRTEIDDQSAKLLVYTNHLLAAFSQTKKAVNADSESLIEPVSARELEVLNLIRDGLSNQEIADHMVIAVSTVKSHINSLYGKFGTHNRIQAVAFARDLGLL